MPSPRQILLAGSSGKQVLSSENAISSGSTLLNLAVADNHRFAFAKGGYYYLVGDSQSGKTFLSLTCFAEACRNPAFKNHRLIFDDVEGGALMDIEHYFGKEVARRLEAPATVKGKSEMSSTVESFYYHVDDLLEEGRPFIYVLDSQDALGSEAARDKFREQKKASVDGKESAGSYGDGKAKYHSEHLRTVLSGLRESDSILIVIGQTRDNLGFGFETKTRSGGRALKFYANLEMWSSVVGKIKRKVRGRDRVVGTNCLVEVKKNRVTGKIGKDRAVLLPIYYGLGIDDIGSCVDFLVQEKHWPKSKGVINATELKREGVRSEIIEDIEARNLEAPVRKLVATIWKQVEDECLVERKKRYE